ncbi:transglutaminase family protein [Candidatus Skiveiella danica]|uniref:transglutaminase family protein n=1 Tax=Candidatus Skiveiella danica TaxID=3386177 RepID=UPI0039B9205D
MSIHAALNHVTHYKYDRPVTLGPQVVRLRPAPHCRSNIISYSLKIEPVGHFVNWQQDPFANYQARLVFPEKATEFKVTVDLVAEMAVYNPFDFFLEPDAEEFPFTYAPELKQELAPYLITEPATPLVQAYLDKIDRTKRRSVIFLVDLNQMVHKDIKYLIRMEPGVQTPEETLTLGSGSCRDSGWLLVQLLRHCGLAARFVSGYLIQLKPDVKSAGRPQRHRGRFHRPARLVRGLPARRRLGGAGRHLRPAGRRRPHSAGLHPHPVKRRAHRRRRGRVRGRVRPPHAGHAHL